MKSPGGGCPAGKGGGETRTLHGGGSGKGAGEGLQPPAVSEGRGWQGTWTSEPRAQPGLERSVRTASDSHPAAQRETRHRHRSQVTRPYLKPGSPLPWAALGFPRPPRGRGPLSGCRPPRTCREPPPLHKPAPDGLAAALGLRTVAGLARFIVSRGRRCCSPHSCHPVRRPSLAHSFIRPRAVRACGLRTKGPRPCRAQLLREAARGPSDRPGRGRGRRQPRLTHHRPAAPAPRSRHGRPGSGSRLHRPRPPTSGATGSKTPQRGQRGREATGAPRRLRAACRALWRREAGRASLQLVLLAPAACR